MEVRQCFDPDVNESIVTIAKVKVPGLTIQNYKKFKDEIVKHTPKLDSKLVMTKLDDVDGHIVTHTLVKMPMFMTNRSVFNLYHQYEQADGSWVDLCSYQGTEDIIKSPIGQNLHGKNVFATNYCDYRLLVPYDGGCYWTSLLCTDIGGSIPASLKNQGAGEMAKNAEGVVYCIMTGKYL